MEIYRSSRKCPKCGGGDTSDQYHDGSHATWDEMKCPERSGKEHIQRRCKRCQYVWVEACVDSQKQEG